MASINTNIHVGNNIKQLRDKMGLTQEALATYLQTSREQIAYYEASMIIKNFHTGG